MRCLLRESQAGSAFKGEHVDVVSSSSHSVEDAEGGRQVLRLIWRIHECDGEGLLGHVSLLVPQSLVPSFQMVDHDLDWRDLDTVEELGDAPFSECEVVGEDLDAGADQPPKLRGLR